MGFQFLNRIVTENPDQGPVAFQDPAIDPVTQHAGRVLFHKLTIMQFRLP